MISNSCKSSNQYTVVNLFIDIGAGLVLSVWFVLAILYLTFIIARLMIRCTTNCLCVSSAC